MHPPGARYTELYDYILHAKIHTKFSIFSIGLGMMVELIASFFFSISKVREFKSISNDSKVMTTYEILKSYLPLSISSTVAMGNGPILSMCISRGNLVLESLALLPVLSGVLNPFSWSAFSMQDTTHAILTKDRSRESEVNEFSIKLGIILSFMLLILVVSPFSDFYLLKINHLTENLYNLTFAPLLILTVIPIATTLKNFYRGKIISEKKPKKLLFSESLEVVLLLVVFMSLNFLTSYPAISLAFFSLWLSSALNTFILSLIAKRK